MFDNIGSKVKTMAKIFCWLGIIGSIITGIALIINGTQYRYQQGTVLYGVLVIIAGSFLSWLSSLGLYAIGESAENSRICAEILAEKTGKNIKHQKKESGYNPLQDKYPGKTARQMGLKRCPVCGKPVYKVDLDKTICDFCHIPYDPQDNPPAN